MRKFNKWLFLSQCSHNWWSEMGMDVRQRFWFCELIVIRFSWGGSELEAVGTSAKGLHPQFMKSLLSLVLPNCCLTTSDLNFWVLSSFIWNGNEKKNNNQKTGTSLHIPQRQFNLTCLNVYFFMETEKGSFPVLYHSIRELCHSKFSHFHFINLLITKKNAWTPW